MYLKKGWNKLYIAQREAGVSLGDIKINSPNAMFSINSQKAKPILWDQYVTINLDFSDGEKRGRSLVHASTIVNTGSNLYSGAKETKPADFATFQVLNPSTSGSSSSHECVKWGDTIVLSAKHNHDNSEGDCAGYGCRIVFVDPNASSNPPTLQYGLVNPELIRILPPGGLFRSPEHCVHSDDHFVLSLMDSLNDHGKQHALGYHGWRNLVFQDSKARFTHGKGLASDLSFRHIHRFRAIEWRDHVRINTGFVANDKNVYGNSVLYTDNLDENVSLKVDYKHNNPQITTFRILPSRDFTGASEKCLSWGDDFVLKLNNNVTEDNCATIYGCRLLYADNLTQDPKFGTIEENQSKFYIHSPTGLKTGCVCAGEQFYLSQHSDSEDQSRVMNINPTTKQ
eukprot:Awhi_evm1s2084